MNIFTAEVSRPVFVVNPVSLIAQACSYTVNNFGAINRINYR